MLSALTYLSLNTFVSWCYFFLSTHEEVSSEMVKYLGQDHTANKYR